MKDLRWWVEYSDVDDNKEGTTKVDVDYELHAIVRSPVIAVRTDV